MCQPPKKPLRLTALAVCLSALSACSSAPRTALIQAPSVFPPANLMTPARPLDGLTWPPPSRPTSAPPAPTPSN